MATLKELSQMTGYSPATISRVLSGDRGLAVPVETRRRVLEAAGELNYAATKSRRGRTPKRLFRVGLAEMLAPEQQLDDPYYLYLHTLVEQACLDSKLEPVFLPRRGEGFLPPADAPAEALIAIGIFTPAEIDSLRAISPNLLFLDSSPEETACDSVVINYRLGIGLALEYLRGLGHSRIAFVGPAEKLDDWKRPAPEERRRLYLEWMGRHGLPALLVDAPMDADHADRAVGRFLTARPQERPTALLCANEETAIGAQKAVRAFGLTIPGGMSLVSFNDTPLSQLQDPPLTSVSLHVREMAAAAVSLVRQRVVTADRPVARTLAHKLVVPPTLVVRESTAPPADSTN